MSTAWQKWLAKRFQFEKVKQLSQKDVLIFIYQQGYLYLILILITFVAGVNYANNLILGFCFLISSVLCISFYLTFKQLHGLNIQVTVTEIGQVDECIELQLHFEQSQKELRYLWIKTDHYLEKILISELKQKISISFLAQHRGQFHYPNLMIYSVYPFGLVRAWTHLYLKKSAWIAPKAEIYHLENKQYLNSPETDMDEFRELRDFQIGDSLHAVSWKQAAQGQGLYIKVFELHQHEPNIEIHYTHMPSTQHEEKLSLMMGLIEQCEQMQCAYSLVLPHTELVMGRGEKHLLQAKKLLAQA